MESLDVTDRGAFLAIAGRHDPYLDTTRLTHDTGFAPVFDVATAVADYVAWRAGNPR